MMMTRLTIGAALGAALLVSALPAHAEDDKVPPVTDPLVAKECGACHMAYQPALLSAASWKTIFGDLSKHFGEDASLPDDKRQAIEAYYVNNASHRGQPGVIRITEQSWWLREHRSVGQSRFASAKSKANCSACHKQAEQGYYEED